MSAAEAAFEFLRSPSGRAMLVRALQRRGLALGLLDDLGAEVVRRVLTAEMTQAIDNAPAFATHVAQFAAADLVRGELRRPTPLLPTAAEDDDPQWEPADDAAVEDTVLAAAALHGLRGALRDAAVNAPSRVASALAYLAARVEDAPPGPACPQPVGGAGAQEAAEWAGLWYGGRYDCFPGSGAKDGPNVRKRRSRAVGQLHEVLVAAATEVQLAGGDDG